jgi:hypothetical protein
MPIQSNVFVDASHARNKLNRRSHTGVLIYLNRSPTIWYSKSQKTVETSTFGSEFMALRVATELIKSLRYKSRMMGVPLDRPANVLVANDLVVKNATVPSSIYKRNTTQYVIIFSGNLAANVMRVTYIPSSENLADTCLLNYLVQQN